MESLQTPVESRNHQLVVMIDSNRGPQDTSKPKEGEMRAADECRSVLGAVVIYLGGPLDWLADREKKGSRSTCEANIGNGRRMQDGGELTQPTGGPGIVHHYYSTPTPLLLGDNQGAICWSLLGAITKKLRHLNTSEIAVWDTDLCGIEIGHIPGPLNHADIFNLPKI